MKQSIFLFLFFLTSAMVVLGQSKGPGTQASNMPAVGNEPAGNIAALETFDGSFCPERRKELYRSAIAPLHVQKRVGIAEADNDRMPYALLTGTENDKTLTFYCGTSIDGALPVDEVYSYPQQRAWDADTANIRKVVFDSSFARYRPVSTRLWFYNLHNLTAVEGIENLDTSETCDMSWMFFRCWSLPALDVSHFSTGKVQDMSFMFDECTSLAELDVSHFDTGNVTAMTEMFRYCTNLKTLDVTGFNTSKVTKMGWMFCACTGLENVDVSLFDTRNVEVMTSMFWNCNNLKTVNVGNFNTGKVTDMGWMFLGCKSLTSLDVSSFDTRNVVFMGYMFRDCSGVQSLNLSNFDTGNVEVMTFMFAGCNSLSSLNLSSFDTHNVENVSCMFSDCWQLTSLDFSNFDTQKVTDMSYMFGGCYRLTSLDLSSFDTRNVVNMRNMFINCSRLTFLNLSSFDTKNLKSTSTMFAYCSNLLLLDLSTFDTHGVTDMSYMFFGCQAMATVYVGDGWTTASVAAHHNMFYNCTSLVGGQGTAYDAGHVDDTYGHADGGTSSPGYFTDKSGSHVCVTDGVCYLLNDMTNTAMVTYHGNNPLSARYFGQVSIPESINVSGRNYTTTAIGTAAFYQCEALQNVTVPGCLSSIEMYSFADCNSLSSITIPPSLRNVGRQAFEGCTAIGEVYISDINAWWHIRFADSRSNPTLWSGNLMLNGQPVTDVEMPVDLTEVGFAQFKGIRSLKTVKLHDGVTRISEVAFQGCTGIETVNFPSALTFIGSSSFHECRSLNVPVDLSKTSIDTLDATCFFNCEKIPSVSLPATLKVINNRAFKNDTGIEAVYSYVTSPETLSTNAKDASGTLDPFGCDRPSDADESYQTIYQKATLYVPEGTVEAYKGSEVFGRFENIVEMKETEGIADLLPGGGNMRKSFWDLQGRRREAPVHGLNIIRTASGSKMKLLAK